MMFTKTSYEITNIYSYIFTTAGCESRKFKKFPSRAFYMLKKVNI